VCCGYFLFCGLLWIDALGIHTDEALFSAGLYPPILPEYTVSVFQKRLPMMVMTYVGTLKSLIYLPIFSIWQPSAVSTRVPVVVIGAVTVWLFYSLLLRTSGRRAALAGCALLGSDPIFILTTKWDWGPVAIQHLCLVSGMLCLMKWHEERRPWMLFAGFFIFGLGLWNKAIFTWSLIGLTAGALAAFPKTLLAVMRQRFIAMAACAFLLGALPLLIYNVRRGFVTFRSNATWSSEAVLHKARLIKDTVEGSALAGWTVRNDRNGWSREPQSKLEAAVVGVSEGLGQPMRSLMGYAFAMSLLLFPVVWRGTWRPVLFSLCFLLATWLQMAFMKGAGTGPHHAVLLWPFPVLIVATVMAAVSYKRKHGGAALGCVTCLLAASNAAVTSTYYRNQIRNGATPGWTDAVYPLVETLRQMDARQVTVINFAFFDTIRLLNQGTVEISIANPPASEAGRAFARVQCGDPQKLFVGQVQESASAPGPAEQFAAFAAGEGFQRRVIAAFADRDGRRVIELFRFEKAGGTAR
jgi:4-amino-4-deoxy-L-arabinose transferase-like glycosyltransferase